MKIRESGMPPEETWQTYFRPAQTLETLCLGRDVAKVVDLGCGYGTFTIPAARITNGTVHAFDVDPSMIEETPGDFGHLRGETTKGRKHDLPGLAP